MTVRPAGFAAGLYFEDQLHDPSTIANDNGVYWVFGTGDGVPSKYSTDLVSWKIGEPIFPIGTWPSWITQINPSFNGTFWAPDVIYFSGKYWVYYTAPGVNGGSSAIGVASTPSLNSPVWTDHGMVVSDNTEPRSSAGEIIGCIDPGLFRDANGGLWMAYGTHYGGIHLRPIDPNTGKRLNENRWGIVGNNGAWNEYEAAAGIYINGYYYMFVTLGECCDGNNSSYHIVMGRSTSPTGPYLDRNGRDMWNYGGTTVLKTEGYQLAPGHFGYFNKNGQNIVSFHYYDDTRVDGWPARVGLAEMTFDVDGWPVLNRDFNLSGATAPTPVNANLIDGATYNIVAKHSGKLVTTSGSGGSCTRIGDGANVYQSTANGSLCQQWVFRKMRDKNGNANDYTQHYWTIHPAGATGKAVDNANFSVLDGNNIHVWASQNNEAQHFRLVDKGNGYYEIMNHASSKVLNVANGSTADGANVEQWRSMGWESQQFSFTYISGGDSTRPAAPTGLVAIAGDGETALDWNNNSESDIGSYNVYRSTTSGSSYVLIETGVGASRYVDKKLTNGQTYYYVVKAADKGYNLSTSYSSQTSAAPTALGARLIAHYKLEGSADDSIGFNHGRTIGSPTYTTGRDGQAIDLDGADDYVKLNPEVADLTDITIATWVNWDGGATAWQRLFDFGHDPDRYMFLTPNSGSGTMRFAITLHGPGEEQRVETATLLTAQWVHVAVTLNGNTATLYVNGAAVAANSAVTSNPLDVSPANNYFGKSQFADPLFNGRVDEFRIYNYALTSTEIAALHSGGGGSPPPAPTGLAATAISSSQINLSWTASSGATTYNVKRSTTSGGPYSTIATGVTATTYSNTGLSASTTYYYVVSAVNSSGESPNSNQASATTQSGGSVATMRVASIVLGTENAGGGKKRAVATVTIQDNLGNPVSSATVTGSFSGSFSETKSGTTGADGKVTLKTTGTKSGQVTFTFCVDNVTHSTLTYDSTQNVVTCATF